MGGPFQTKIGILSWRRHVHCWSSNQRQSGRGHILNWPRGASNELFNFNQKLWSTTNSWQVQRQPEFWNWSSSSLPLHNQTQERTRLPQLPHHNLHQSLLTLVHQALTRPVWLTSFLRMWWQILLTNKLEEPSAVGCATSTVNETYNALDTEMPDLEELPTSTQACSFSPSMFACNNEEPASGVACSEHQQRSDTEQPTTTSKKRGRFVCRTLTAILLIYSASVDSHKTSCNNSFITCQSIMLASCIHSNTNRLPGFSQTSPGRTSIIRARACNLG